MSQSESFPELLRNYRRSQGWTQSRLAKTFGFSPETISAWERGKRVPNGQEIPHLADLLSMKPEELVRYIDASRVHLEMHKSHEKATDATKRERESQKTTDTWKELLYIYRDRTELSRNFSYPHLFENAHDILAVGISLNAVTMNYSTETIIKLITEKDCTISLCFLDPDGVYCKAREIEEGYSLGTLSHLTNINIASMQQVLRRVGQIAPQYAQQLNIMKYDLSPRFNIYVIDNVLMTMQSYAYDRGEDTPTFVLKRQGPGGLFDFYASTARYILEHSTFAQAEIK